MSKVLFIDPVSPRAYTPEDVHSGGLGGTESAVVRTADRLAKEGYDVYVHNHLTTTLKIYGGVKYTADSSAVNPKTVIVLRSFTHALEARKEHPKANIWVWMHDLIRPNILPYIKALVDNRIGLLVVSDYHKGNLIDMLKMLPPALEYPRIRRIHNMIPDDLQAGPVKVDLHKLTFISSPHKGLKYTVEVFEQLHRVHPEYKLYITNPGYYPDFKADTNGVVNLGSLPQKEALEHVRNSLCLFYLNHEYPETFGMVLAEANAVGTPVLTHPIGAAREVLGDPNQLMDTRNVQGVIDKILSWTKNRPEVRVNDKFRESNVIKQWKEIL